MAPPVSSQAYVDLAAGDPAPWFRQRSPVNPRFDFSSTGGRYNVLCFFGTAGDPVAAETLAAVMRRGDLFDGTRAAFWGVSCDPADEAQSRIANRPPGVRFFWDFDLKVARLYGAAPSRGEPGQPLRLRRLWVVLDPTFRVLEIIPFAADGSDHERVFACLAALPPPERFAGFEVQAPVLILPNVFEPAFCRRLIERYEAHGGEESGIVREIDGKSANVLDARAKRRRDHLLKEQALIDGARARIQRRVVPEILKVHQFKVTRMERYIVCCYAAEDGGHFGAHRDNTTRATAHRRFAVSINLNDDFEGGTVHFPEYGPRGYKAPAGGAVVFSCSLLHAVSRVTSGRRYAFLPFLYDEEGARLRAANNAFLGENIAPYRGSDPPAPTAAAPPGQRAD